jgi:hypothetical protein
MQEALLAAEAHSRTLSDAKASLERSAAEAATELERARGAAEAARAEAQAAKLRHDALVEQVSRSDAARKAASAAAERAHALALEDANAQLEDAKSKAKTLAAALRSARRGSQARFDTDAALRAAASTADGGATAQVSLAELTAAEAARHTPPRSLSPGLSPLHSPASGVASRVRRATREMATTVRPGELARRLSGDGALRRRSAELIERMTRMSEAESQHLAALQARGDENAPPVEGEVTAKSLGLESPVAARPRRALSGLPQEGNVTMSRRGRGSSALP